MTLTQTLANVDPQSGKLSLSLHEMLAASDTQGSVSEDEGSGQQKRSFQPYHAQSVPKLENLEAHACERDGNAVTTVMLRNIPNKYTQNTLLQEINETGFEGTYNFFYLPMDVHNRSNVGYAFINFERPADAERFRRSFSDHQFQRFHSRKIGIVCIAHVQGLDENLRHFENRAVTQARNDQYRPIVLKGQRRIDFEDAVAEAKARIAQREATGPNGKPTNGATKPDRPADVHVSNGEQPKVLPSASVQGAADARQGLEAAIRDLLASSPQACSASSTSTSPASGFDVAAGAPNSFGNLIQPSKEEHLNGVSPHQLQKGANVTAFTPALYGKTAGCQEDMDSDVAQLLSLRSLLVDRLLQKDQAVYPGVNSAMTASWGLAPPPGIDFKSNLEATKLAPNTQDLIIGNMANGFAFDSHWCAL